MSSINSTNITSASKACKEAGLKSLAELASLSKQSTQTLDNWSKHKPELFKLLIAGAVSTKMLERINAL